MNKEFFEAVRELEKEKGIPAEYLYDKIQAAIVVAVKKDYNGKDVISCEIHPETEEMKVYLHKTVSKPWKIPIVRFPWKTPRSIKKTPRRAMKS